MCVCVFVCVQYTYMVNCVLQHTSPISVIVYTNTSDQRKS